MAQKWYETGSYQMMLQEIPGIAWIPPGFLWCLKSLLVLNIPVEITGVGFNIFCGVLLVPIVYALAWEIFHSQKIALITAAFLAVHPSINNLSIDITRDILSLTLQGAVLWCAIAGIRRKNWICWSLSALLAGMNFLVRYESIECIPIIGIILTVLIIKRKFPWKKAVIFSGIWLITFVVSFIICVSCMEKKDVLISYNRYLSGKTLNVSRKLSDAFKKGENSK